MASRNYELQGNKQGNVKGGEERARAGSSEWRKVSAAIRASTRTKREGGRKQWAAVPSGLEAATLRKWLTAELEEAEIKALGLVLGVSRMDGIRNKDIRRDSTCWMFRRYIQRGENWGHFWQRAEKWQWILCRRTLRLELAGRRNRERTCRGGEKQTWSLLVWK